MNQLQVFYMVLLIEKKNGLVEEYSHQYELFYEIDKKKITINPVYLKYIVNNRASLVEEVKQFIERRYIDK